jgi:glycosyltransferase involved in cell wall biosynthesis
VGGVKILMVSDSLGSGGAQNQMCLLAEGLKSKGYDVIVITYHKDDFFKSRLQKANVKNIHIQKRSKLGVNVIREMAKLIHREKVDQIISFQITPNFYALAANKLSRCFTPTIISYRSKTDYSKLSWIHLKLQEWMNKETTYIVCNSHHERKRWMKRYPKLRDKLFTIYNGIDQSIFYPIDKERNHFLVVGKLRPLKNAHALIEAVRILKHRHHVDIVVHWYGSRKFSQSRFQQYSETTMQKVVEYKLEDNFLWYDPVKYLPSVYNQHEALIHPSLWEGLPNAICEALACGTPVLASNILDHPILVKQEGRGFLFDPTDPEKIVLAILKFLSLDNIDKKQMSDNCTEYARRELSLASMIGSYENLIL